ncbi:MAG: redoxin domain-containing protein, partial [Pseudoxanthomonas sp.]
MIPFQAPELPPSVRWLNAAPATLRELGGRVLALAFVNPASAWCAQRLQELARLQARSGGRLQPLAVAVPRFDCERDGEAALRRLRRHGIGFPVLHDPDWQAWQRFGVEAWPTVLLIDPVGQVRYRSLGDQAGVLEQHVQALYQQAGDNAERIAETHAEPRAPLRFPTGLVATDERLYVADSGHHRILECTHAGRVLRRFGTGTADFADGDGEAAAFDRPHALALLHTGLYVADTGNHAIRRIDLASGQVDTLLGNGRCGTPQEGPVTAAKDVGLDTPRALVASNSQLHFALAGDHRIWSWDLGAHRLQCRAGSGQLGTRDGAGALAAFAQPAGLAAVQQTLYVCEELGSAIRSVQLRGDVVQTLVGAGPWQFGDHDGARAEARLQAPEAIALDPDSPRLWIADTGNGCVRSLRLGGGELARVP